MILIKDSNILDHPSDLVGNKAHNLSKLINLGYKVPNFCVITTLQYKNCILNQPFFAEVVKLYNEISNVKLFCKKAQEILEKRISISEEDIDSVFRFIKNYPNNLSIRSSANLEDGAKLSFAGIFKSFLNIERDEVIPYIIKCWLSVFTETSIHYLIMNNIRIRDVSMGVILQEQLHPDYSGSLTTIDLKSNRNDLYNIEIIKGLGDDLMSGRKSPKSIKIYKNEVLLNDKIELSKLSYNSKIDNLLYCLCKKAINIEDKFKFPLEFEWAIEDNSLFFLQVRPLKSVKFDSNKFIFLEKTITRDWILIFAELWHKIYIGEFKNQYNWQYSEIIYEFKNEMVNVYRPFIEHYSTLPKFLNNFIENDYKAFVEKSISAIYITKQLESIINSVYDLELEEIAPNRLYDIFLKIYKLHIKLGPTYVLLLWIPILLDKNKFSNQIIDTIQRRKKIQHIGQSTNKVFQYLIEQILIKLNIEVKYAPFINFNEFTSLVTENQFNSDIIEQRFKQYLITKNGVLNISLKNFCRTNKYRLRESKYSIQNKLKGDVAFPGYIEGKVKVILNKKMFNKLKKGEIIVAPTTTTDYIPLFQTCSGIITDEGGITSHAALLAREYKIPCLVNTKFSTQILKDNDQVILDSENGFVLINN